MRIKCLAQGHYTAAGASRFEPGTLRLRAVVLSTEPQQQLQKFTGMPVFDGGGGGGGGGAKLTMSR